VCPGEDSEGWYGRARSEVVIFNPKPEPANDPGRFSAERGGPDPVRRCRGRGRSVGTPVSSAGRKIEMGDPIEPEVGPDPNRIPVPATPFPGPEPAALSIPTPKCPRECALLTLNRGYSLDGLRGLSGGWRRAGLEFVFDMEFESMIDGGNGKNDEEGVGVVFAADAGAAGNGKLSRSPAVSPAIVPVPEGLVHPPETSPIARSCNCNLSRPTSPVKPDPGRSLIPHPGLSLTVSSSGNVSMERSV
jgi:hypothetical protein